MTHRSMCRVAVLMLFATLIGCDWFVHDVTFDAENDATVGDAATVDTGADESLINTSLPPTASNPQRDVADPYYLVGEPIAEWDLGRWANLEAMPIDEPITLEKLRGRVTVVRFWTDASDACARTMPALQRLADEFRNEPVTFVGIYFTSGALVDDIWADAQARARYWGVTFPIAEDHRTLNDWWRTRFDNLPETPTFVIGTDGRVVHVHPGPELYPSDDPTETLPDADFRALRTAITGALDRQVADSRPQ